MKRVLLLLTFLFAAAVSARATDITVPQTTGVTWTRTTTAPQLRVFYSQTFTASDSVIVIGGNPQTGGLAWKTITCTLLSGTLTIPSFTIKSTRDGIDRTTAVVSFFFFTSAGANLGPFDPYVNLQIPASITSASGCSPAGTCSTLAELKNLQSGIPPQPPPQFYTATQIDRLFATNIATGAPADATYILKTPNATLTNSFALSSLSNGLIKHSGGTPALAVVGTDYVSPTGSGAGLTALNATQLTSGTIPDGRFPATFPAVSGLNLTALNATQLTSGTIPDARFPATYPAGSGVNLTALNATQLTSGTIPIARGQEVWAVTDLSTYASASGTGTAAIRATVTSLATNDVLTWDGSNWINQAASTGFSDPMTTRGDIIYRNSSNATARLPLGAANRYLSSNGSDASWGQVDLTAGVTGTLPSANGGTGLTLGAANRILGVNSAATLNEYKDLAVGTSGTTPAIVHTASTVTFNFPLMASSSVTSGLLSNTTQTIPGLKSFSTGIYDGGGQVFNVKVYGALGDGTTDDTAAFAAAIAAAGAAKGGIVLVPQSASSYRVGVLLIGDGTSTTVSTYNGVRLVGVGGTYDEINSPTVRLQYNGAAGQTWIKAAGPISGVAVEGIVFNCVGTNSAAIGIQAMHADGFIFKNSEVKGCTSVLLDIDAYDATSFNGGSFTGVLSQDGHVENIYLNSIGVNNTTLVRVGNTGSISGWNFMGGRYRADGATGSTAVQLSFADHNNFWGLTAKAAVGVRIKAITGHTGFPVNNPFFFSSMNGSSAANAYVVDNSIATWAPAAGLTYGQPFFGLPTIDSGPTTTPHTTANLWGWDDLGRMFGTWSVISSTGFNMTPYGTSTGNMSELRFLELVANGVNYTGFKAPDSIATNAIYKLPDAYPASNKVLQSDSTGTLTWVTNVSGGAPTSSTYVLLSADFSLPNARTLLGTTNQITVTDSGAGNNVTLSIPSTLVQPTLAGGTGTGSQLILRSTSNATPANGSSIFMQGEPNFASVYGSVYVGIDPTIGGALYKMQIVDSGTSGLSIMSDNAVAGSGAGGIHASTSVIPTAINQRTSFYAFGASNQIFTNANNAAAITGYSSEAWTFGSVQGFHLRMETTPTGSATRATRELIGLDKTLTDAATSLFEIALTAGSMTGGQIEWTIVASDGTNHQAFSGITTYAVVNKAGVYTKTFTNDTGNDAKAVSSGTLTVAWAATDGANKVTVTVTPTGSLVETTYKIYYKVINNSPQVITLL